MLLPDLPNEILLSIADRVKLERDLSAFSRASRALHFLLSDYLYVRNAVRSRCSALLWSAEEGRLDTARKALKNKANPVVKDKSHRTPLFVAASAGHADVVELLLAVKDVNPKILDWTGWSPLSVAAASGHEKVVELLLQHADQVSNWGPAGGIDMSLELAARYGQGAVVKVMLRQKGIDVNSRDFGPTPLISAAEDGHAAVVSLLLDDGRVSPRKRARTGQTALQRASVRGHDEVVKVLLQRGEADLNFRENRHGETAFYGAAKNDQERVVKLLLSQEGVDPNLQDWNGNSPLMAAVRHGCESTVSALLGHEAVDPNLQSSGGETPLFTAVEKRHDRIVELLLGSNKVFNIDSSDGLTPLSLARKRGQDYVACLLLAKMQIQAAG